MNIDKTKTRPPVIWVTGLAGAGKTTIAEILYESLRKSDQRVVKLDGDAIRDVCDNDLGHSLVERIKNAYRLCRFAEYLNSQSLTVICSTMSLYSEIWEWNRIHFPNYFEIYLKVSNETLNLRNKKNLYTDTNHTTQKNVVGVDLGFNEPPNPTLTLINEPPSDAQSNVSIILKTLSERKVI
jgi:adenylylsulfate kinase